MPDGGITKIGGFPPWPYKYTTHVHPGKTRGSAHGVGIHAA